MKFYNLCLVALELSLTSLVVSLQSHNRCPSSLQFSTNLKVFRGTCYQFIPTEKDWYEARDYCKKYGGYLATIPDSDTNDFLTKELNSLWWKNNGIWIGLNDLDEDGLFTWTSKTPNHKLGSWTNWGHGHPGAFLSSHRDCIRMVRANGWKWHETPCKFPGFQYRFICQYDSVQPVSISSRINIAIKPAYGSTQSISSDNANFHYEPPVASLKQGQDFKIGGSQNEGHDSKTWQVILMCTACLVVLLVVAVVFVYRRRRQQSDKQMDASDIKNSSLEQASRLNAKVENIYIGESMQKFLKLKEESIYEEIPYDLVKVEIAKA